MSYRIPCNSAMGLIQSFGDWLCLNWRWSQSDSSSRNCSQNLTVDLLSLKHSTSNWKVCFTYVQIRFLLVGGAITLLEGSPWPIQWHLRWKSFIAMATSVTLSWRKICYSAWWTGKKEITVMLQRSRSKMFRYILFIDNLIIFIYYILWFAVNAVL